MIPIYYKKKRPNLDLHISTMRELMVKVEEIFITTRVIAYKRYNFREENQTLEQFQVDIVELASCADCGNREDESDRGMLTPLRNKEKIAKELLAKTQSPQDAYEYAIRREKGIKHTPKN